MNEKCKSKMVAFLSVLVGIFFLQSNVCQAQQEPKLDLRTTVEKEVKVLRDGKETKARVPIEKTNPGDVLVYTIVYRNIGSSQVTDAGIVNPVPSGVVYLSDTAEGQDAEITLSIDNSRSWHKPPIMMQVKKKDGRIENQPVPMERYTHIRWIIKKPIQPGQSGQVRFKANVK